MKDFTSNIELQDALALGYNDLSVFGKMMFPERFFRNFDAIHNQIFELLQRSDSQKIAIAAPRGIGKTSINNLLLPSWYALYQETDYIVQVSATATSASQQSDNLKYELTTNDTILKLFGDISTNVFNKEQWVVRVGGENGKEICIMPRGAGQQIRGLLFRNSRPGLILVDDLEDPEQVDSEEQRAKKKRWFYADLLNAVDRGSKTWKVVVLGTILHEDSLLVNLLENPDWDSVTLELCDDDYNSNVPSMLNNDECRALEESYRLAGELDVFFREYRSKPISTKDSVFQKTYFKYFEEKELVGLKTLENIILIDPARTAKMESADSAIVGVGVDTQNQSIYVRDVVAHKMHQNEFYDQVVEMCKRLRPRAIGVEVTGLHEFITYPLKNALSQAGLHGVEVIELHARGGVNEKGKVQRVKTLAPLYRSGQIYHNKSCSAKLEGQLMSFPRSKLWDVMDALSYVTEMLEIGGRYMMPSAGEQDDEYDDYSSVEREMAEVMVDALSDDPVPDFRII